ncbi:hypothetical protein V6N00_13005 [Tersicoccus sp. MR15.9]|uniref:hypothetical protein n=1 Tax=Tersicoccus mangrovi TaxID=3121635 RepID=UPI002FE6369F
MTVPRRQLLTHDGDSLLLTRSAADTVLRFVEWRAATGMDPSSFTFNPILTVPLPIYGPMPDGGRRFADVNPAALWHPLFWLPKRLAGRFMIPSPDGGESIAESDAIRAIRIALELSASGLYNAEGWVDILAASGIDIDRPTDLDRVAAWQAGAPDEILDSIDLEPYLRLDTDPHWALVSAMGLEDDMQHAQWALLADSLIEELDEADDEEDLTSYRNAVGVIATMAEAQLAEIPTDGDGAASFWSGLSLEAGEGIYASREAFADGPVHAGSQWLYKVREEYWPAVAELQQLEHA